MNELVEERKERTWMIHKFFVDLCLKKEYKYIIDVKKIISPPVHMKRMRAQHWEVGPGTLGRKRPEIK